jgi:hypothetical protein
VNYDDDNDDEEYHHEAEDDENEEELEGDKNRLTQTRSMMSPQRMQERMPIQPYMRRKINRNNWKH